MVERARQARDAAAEKVGTARENTAEAVAAAKENAADAIAKVKPRLRGVSHEWAFFASLIAGGALVWFADPGKARIAETLDGPLACGEAGVPVGG